MKITKILFFALFGIVLLVFAVACVETASPPSTSAPSTNQGTVSVPNDPSVSVPADGAISLDRNLYIIVDGSGSMESSSCAAGYKNRIEAAKWAVEKFVKDVVPGDVGLGLLIFDSRGMYERVPLGKNNRGLILQEVVNMNGGGGTPLSESLVIATKALVKQRAKQLGYGEFQIVVATDGQADVSRGAQYALQNEIPIITIGFCLDKDKEHPLAKYSTSYRNTQDPQQLFEALEETQAELPEYDVR